MSISNPSNVWREMPERPGIASGWGREACGGVAGLRVGRYGRWWCCWPHGGKVWLMVVLLVLDFLLDDIVVQLAFKNMSNVCRRAFFFFLFVQFPVTIVSTGYYPIGL